MTDGSSRRAHVLVVDDERGPRESLRMILAPGHEVLTVASGAEALRALHTAPVDVVLLDLAMPGLRGTELMRAIRLDFPDVEMIVVTGHATLETATEAIRNGVCDYLQKPFDVVQVTAAVYRALARRRGRRRLVSFLEDLADVVGRDVHVADILAQVERDAGLRSRLAEVLARAAADFAPAPAEPEHTLPFFEVLADAIESQDPLMRGHARRTAFYASLLADRSNLSPGEKREARLAAFLHDIGKIGVPSFLLGRRDPLAADERRAIERHPEVGARLIEPLGVTAGLVTAVRHHHERWDGDGYPDGLAGEAIPLAARIVAIADAFDAMTGGRPDRATRSRAEALAELARCAGTQFDPMLVKEFASVAESAVDEAELDLVAEVVATLGTGSESAVPSARQLD